MTTAHKPTWQPARGTETGGASLSVPTRTYSSRDLPGHLTLKVRQDGQDSRNDLKYKDFKAELLEKEKKYQREKNEKLGIYNQNEQEKKDPITYKEPEQRKKLKTEQSNVIQQLNQYGSDDEEQELKNKPISGLGDKDEESDSNSSSSEEIDEEAIKKKAAESINPFPQDADDLDFANTSSDESEKGGKDEENSSQNSSSSSDSDSDDDELLMKEYQKIKEQREAEEKEKLRLKQEELEKQRQQNLLTHNPLLDQTSYNLKKKWYEDSVFKNQAKKDKDDKQRFINDNVRSDFHRKFLKKFIYT